MRDGETLSNFLRLLRNVRRSLTCSNRLRRFSFPSELDRGERIRFPRPGVSGLEFDPPPAPP